MNLYYNKNSRLKGSEFMKRKRLKYCLLILTLLMPFIVMAENSDSFPNNPVVVFFAIFWLIAVSSAWKKVLRIPFANTQSKNPKQIVFILNTVRLLITILIAIKYPYVFIIDYILLCVFLFTISIIRFSKGGINMQSQISVNLNPTIIQTPTGTITCPKCKRVMAYGNTRCVVCGTDLRNTAYRCSKCNVENLPTAKFCKNCGAEMILTEVTASAAASTPTCPKCKAVLIENAKFCRECGENVEKVIAALPKVLRASDGTAIAPNTYDMNLLNGNLDKSIQYFVQKELALNANYKKMTTPSIEKRKLITTGIYVIITFILASLYVFLHTYGALYFLLWFVATIICISISTKYNLEKYIMNEVKKRPDEKISYIVSSILSGAKTNKGALMFSRWAVIAACFILIIAIYDKPHLIYEHQQNGYFLRYHTYGLLTKEKEVTIPETYKGKKVIGIRGNTFKNEKSLEKVTLPNSITEIRGGAFEGCTNLTTINLPTNILELHGSIFKDCESLETIVIPHGVTRIGGNSFENTGIKEITIPESVTEIGGEAFMGCTELSKVNLPSKITEVHGSTFEGCTSLGSIDIPEGVTRIGGSAFRDCVNLREAKIPKTVTDFGSSAFRNTALTTVCISKYASVNERTFKETYPTIYYHEDGCKDSSNSNYNSWGAYSYEQ